MLSVRLSKNLEDRLDALAAQTNRAKSYYVKKALTQFLEDQEEIEWATQAYKDYLESGERTYSLEEIKKMHDLAPIFESTLKIDSSKGEGERSV
jgi:RHH-type rel operon transcriptional repressor/antitoxin RelB